MLTGNNEVSFFIVFTDVFFFLPKFLIPDHKRLKKKKKKDPSSRKYNTVRFLLIPVQWLPPILFPCSKATSFFLRDTIGTTGWTDGTHYGQDQNNASISFKSGSFNYRRTKIYQKYTRYILYIDTEHICFKTLDHSYYTPTASTVAFARSNWINWFLTTRQLRLVHL